MSQMTRCDEGHFYDKSQNTKCPFCGVGSVDIKGDVDLTVKYDNSNLKPDGGGDEKTIRYDPNSNKRINSNLADPEATVAVWKKGAGIDPVVGWLVCHEGANQGRDYRIRAGFNNIGRDTSSQICIAGDETIAREEHAKIFFDVKSACFHVVSGSGRSGIYVNNQVVLQPTVLKAYDVLEIGSTKLIFVPFCGENFRWNIGGL